MDCEAELFLGPDELTKVARSGRVPFVSTGAAQSVRLPIAMPSDEGAYHGYIDVFTEGLRFLAYKAKEDVVIAVPAVPQFYMPSAMTVKVTNGSILGMYWNCEVWCDITNNGDAPGTRNVHIWDSGGIVDVTIEVTLQPGETYTWHRSQWADFRRINSYSVWAEGDWEGDNYSAGVCGP